MTPATARARQDGSAGCLICVWMGFEPEPQPAHTYCRSGLHEWTPQNTVTRVRGDLITRECRACERARVPGKLARRAAKKRGIGIGLRRTG